MYTKNEEILISVAPYVILASTELCIETAAILEAHKLNTEVTHTICVVREDENAEYVILSHCGVCQKRLFYCGENAKAGVPNSNNNLEFKAVRPYHWYKAYRS